MEPPKKLKSLEECQAAAQLAREQYADLGCSIWYCYAVSPEGKQIKLIEGELYRSCAAKRFSLKLQGFFVQLLSLTTDLNCTCELQNSNERF
jgi:hypothetical protein